MYSGLIWNYFLVLCRFYFFFAYCNVFRFLYLFFIFLKNNYFYCQILYTGTWFYIYTMNFFYGKSLRKKYVIYYKTLISFSLNVRIFCLKCSLKKCFSKNMFLMHFQHFQKFWKIFALFKFMLVYHNIKLELVKFIFSFLSYFTF